MVEVLNRKDGFTERDLAMLLGLLDKYPYFELAQNKLLEATSQLGIHGPLEEKIRKRREIFDEIGDLKNDNKELTSQPRESKELLAEFLNNYQLPTSPLYFQDK